MTLQPHIARLKSQLAVTGLQKKDNALFQVISGLIRAVEQSQAATEESISGGSGGGGLTSLDYLTHSNESGTLPNSRNLLPGLGVQFDDTVANERTVDVIGDREVENVVTGSIASGATESGFWAIGATTWQIIQLVKVQSDRAGYLVLYASVADRDADTRALPATTDPVAGEGIFLDAAFNSTVVSIDVSPPVVLYNNEAPVVQKVYYRFFNQEATAGVTTFTLTFVVSNGGGGTGGGSIAVAHNMLSATHSDSTPAAGVNGDLIVHDTTWKRLAKGTDGRALVMVAGLPVWSLDGSALSLNASNLASGTVPDARLSTNVPRLNAINVFTPRQIIQGAFGGASAVLSLIETGISKLYLQLQRTGGTTSMWQLFLPSGSTDIRANYNGGTDLLTLTNAGDLSVANALIPLGGQVKFPAIQNPSADVNTLDDYEEGTWTPIIGGSGGESGQVYSSQIGYYTKIGNRIAVYFRVALLTLGTITGNVQVKGLPFTSKNITNLRCIGTMNWANTMTAYYTMFSQIIENNSAVTLIGIIASVTATPGITQADLSDTVIFAGSLEYIVD